MRRISLRTWHLADNCRVYTFRDEMNKHDAIEL
jgi:hypothetical protein